MWRRSPKQTRWRRQSCTTQQYTEGGWLLIEHTQGFGSDLAQTDAFTYGSSEPQARGDGLPNVHRPALRGFEFRSPTARNHPFKFRFIEQANIDINHKL